MGRLRNGVGVGISNIPTLSSRRAFSPLSLFAGGTQGVWYDDSLTSSMYQDSAGTVAAVLESPVGKQLDLSGNNNHRTQATSANRPTLSARYNLFTKTEDFSNAAWTKVGLTVDATLYTAPNGTLTANKINPTISPTNHYLYQSISLTNGVSYAATINGKVGEYRYLYLQTYNGSAFAASIVDLQTGLVTQTGSGHTITSVAVDNGFYYVKIVFTAAATGTGYFYAGPSDVSTAPTAYSWIGDPAKGIYIWGADFRPTNQTVTLPVYQRVDTSSVYDTVGFPQYIKYNGSNSSLSTASINFTATAQMSVFSGVRKLVDSTYQILAELSASSATNNGSFALGTSGTTSTDFFVAARETNLLYGDSPSFPAPTTKTLAEFIDLTQSVNASILQLKINNASAAISFVGLGVGSGNFGNYAFYFGSRAGAQYWFNGQEFQTIIVGKTLTATEIANTETYVNSKTKAY